jgi:hypothetical protein
MLATRNGTMVLFIPVYIDHCSTSGQSNTVRLCYVVCYLSFIHSLSVVCILRNINIVKTWVEEIAVFIVNIVKILVVEIAVFIFKIVNK